MRLASSRSRSRLHVSTVSEPGWKFTIVLASTSAQPLAHDSVNLVKDRLAYQDPGNSGTFTFEQFTLNPVTASIEHAFDAAKINLTIELHDWGCMNAPFVAYYGKATLDAIMKWREHGQPLFHKNLRGFMKSSDVSESISRTLSSESELFWYLNNGATILCARIERQGPYSQHTSRERGHFYCVGVSVVNGAQTIGSIWEQPGDGQNLDPRAMVHLRLISLEGTRDHCTASSSTSK
jgi:AIPR protein